jgi:uncharacterized protein (TIGR00299 family) protein
MLLASLIDLGASLDNVRAQLSTLNLDNEFSIDCEQVMRCGIKGNHLIIKEPTQHNHHHHHEHNDHHSHGPARNLPIICELLTKSNLPESIKARSLTIFTSLASAEAEIHGKDINEVHFHEVSGIDTIIDIVGCCIALEDLEIDSISTGPVSVGTGFINCAHGEMPLPAPATAMLLKDGIIQQRNIPFELTTPTGAAILSSITESWGPCPNMTINAIGYGAGTRDLPNVSNTLRIMLGNTESQTAYEQDEIQQLTCALDDCTGETLAHTIETALANGALDAYVRHLTMKKGRPAYELVVLTPQEHEDEMLKIIFQECSTFGIRIETIKRALLQRESIKVTIASGSIRVKAGRYNGEVIQISAEDADCRIIAKQTGRPLTEIRTEAEHLARQSLAKDSQINKNGARSFYFSQPETIMEEHKHE